MARRERTIVPDAALRSLVDAHAQPFALLDREFNIVACNELYAQAYARQPADALIGRKCFEISHRSDEKCELNGEECPLERVFASGEAVQVMHRHFESGGREAEYLAIHGSPLYGADGEVRYMGETMCPLRLGGEALFDEPQPADEAPLVAGIRRILAMVAESNLPVLISGEAGTGKKTAAQLIHLQSSRAGREFVVVDCAAFARELLQDALFGHEAGAFAFSRDAKPGLVEVADKGTLFLGEIGELSSADQARLLRFVETQAYRRIGGTELRKADVRMICSTNRDLREMVGEGHFRADLYYRLAGMHVDLPPLRHRREDVPPLARFFGKRFGGPFQTIGDEAIRLLCEYPFPGNVRELRNLIEQAVARARGDSIGPEHIPPEVHRVKRLPAAVESANCYRMPVEVERTAITSEAVARALRRARGKRREAARLLGISERTLYRWLSKADGTVNHAENASS